MKKIFIGIVSVVFVLTTSIMALAITDPGGDNIGTLDLTEAEAEAYERGDQTLMKLSINATPHVPGAIVFECDLDNSTGTGGIISQLGSPVDPCPCKTEPGFDVAISISIRRGQSPFCGGCENPQGGTCERGRESGEWYALVSAGGEPARYLGVIRGLLDPPPKLPGSGETEDCYTLPWDQIISYAHIELNGNPKQFNYQKAIDSANNKWQVSIWYDPDNYDTDSSDISSGVFPTQTFDINDWAPNTGKADVVLSTGATDLTYCEGNFDGDKDVDGGDAAKFKANFGRSPFKNPCPACGPNY
jgi:hypothetical protein